MRSNFIFVVICTLISLLLLYLYNKVGRKSLTPLLTDFQKTNSTMECATPLPQKPFSTRKNLIIISPGRGGSSFLGSLFNENPYVMYSFEPFFAITGKIFHVDLVKGEKEPKNYKQAFLRVIDGFLKCDFTNFSKTTISALLRDRWHLLHSKALSNKNLARFSRTLLTTTCENHNYTVIKILSARVPNKTIETLRELFQEQSHYNVKVVHLVRDPRAVVNSRVNLKWMKDHLHPSFSDNVRRICNPILQNIRFGLLFPPPWLKNRFLIIRYEDLVENTVNITRELYRFAEFDWSASIDKWISKQAYNSKQGTEYSVFRNATAAIHGWKNAPMPFIRAVEDECRDLMDFLGYEKYTY